MAETASPVMEDDEANDEKWTEELTAHWGGVNQQSWKMGEKAGTAKGFRDSGPLSLPKPDFSGSLFLFI